jgi:hypothetical protein
MRENFRGMGMVSLIFRPWPKLLLLLLLLLLLPLLPLPLLMALLALLLLFPGRRALVGPGTRSTVAFSGKLDDPDSGYESVPLLIPPPQLSLVLLLLQLLLLLLLLLLLFALLLLLLPSPLQPM